MLISESRGSLTIVAILFATLLFGSVPGPNSPQAAAATTGPMVSARPATSNPTAAYPLPPKSSAGQLRWKARKKLPRIKAWSERIIGSAMDQPAGLMETQVVSAFHIHRVFKRKLGKKAWRSALRIAWRESRLLPNAVNDKNKNKTNDWGLFQLNDGGTLQYAGLLPDSNALHPRRNARAARMIVRTTGWWPWGGRLCKNGPCG